MIAKPIIPWIGGKRKLAGEILPLIPPHQCYVEPFCGAAAIFFLKEQSKAEVLNDINGELTNLYKIAKLHFEELYKQFRFTLISRVTWEELKNTPPETLTDVQRAARFLYIQKLAFGGLVENQTFGTSTTTKPKFNLLSLEADLSDAHIRLSNTTIENLDWLKAIEKYDRQDTFFYCDPPYFETAGYGFVFEYENYEILAERMKNIKGKMLISINDHECIKDTFRSFPIKEISYKYSVSVGDQSDVKEILIANWDKAFTDYKGHQTNFFEN